MKYIQNRTNWCWVAACKVAGEQYKKNFVDAWQSAIARNADFLHGGLAGKFPHGFKRYWRKSFVTFILFPQGSRP